ncbi:MAG: hypothetical protein M1817_006640 [Caeruleum heppii]|nr:MAG: hypothetical protein M1817_006640 [Caeruleum heppii]
MPYPAKTNQVAGPVSSVHTDIMSISFADKILITITQAGCLAQWIHVPLDTTNPTFADQYLPTPSTEDSLLPLPSLTPTTILGSAGSDRETIGQLYATQIASMIASKNPDEKRTVVVGLGLPKVSTDQATFLDLMELVVQCL